MTAGHLFISYSHEDKEFVERLAMALQSGGQSVWLDRWELQAGDSVIDRIFEKGLGEAAAFAVVLSRSSLKSPWVHEELNTATLRRITERTKVIPVLIADVEVPLALRTLQWVDMRNNFDAGVRAIMNSLFGIRERPPVGELPTYLRAVPKPVGGLSHIATSVGGTVLQANDPDSENERAFDGGELADLLGLQPQEINDAVAELEERGLLQVVRTLGTTPYKFAAVEPSYLLFLHFAELIGYDPGNDVIVVLQAVAAGDNLDGEALRARTGLSYGRLNRASDYIREHGLANVHRFLGTHPYSFGYITATHRTRQAAANGSP